MRTIEEIKQELASQGYNPDDFTIDISEPFTSVYPNIDLNIRKVAKDEDRPILEDVSDVAEFATIVAMDKDEIAEMLVYTLQRIDELEAKING